MDWDSTFTSLYGESVIPNQNESNGRHWYHKAYAIDGISSKISITLWMKPKDNQSKLVIQSSKHLMTMMWVANELPSIFLQVLNKETKKIGTDGNEKPSITSKAQGYTCSLCDFKTTRSAVLKNHKKTEHGETFQCYYCDQKRMDIQ